mmetsp:Transcript_6833/g.12361  ORF Transcript_6833/g.12361 Transcript_6833/m.12361 type:complete len:559 (+) Transcript_6833:70-1746(+)
MSALQTVSKPVGLVNSAGEQNCFLNTAVQVLWHINSFRNTMLRSSCPETHSCVVCELKRICLDYSSRRTTGQGGIVSTRGLRRELARVDPEKFNIEETADSVEALVTILAGLHSVAVHDSSERASNIRCSPTCTAHSVFGLEVIEYTRCGCGEESLKPWDYSTYMLPIYINELTENDGDSSCLVNLNPDDLLRTKAKSSVLPVVSGLLKYFNEAFRKKSLCPADRCQGSTASTLTTVRGMPSVISLSLVWPERDPSSLKVLRSLASLPHTLSLAQIHGQTSEHKLVGMILYSGAHYIAFSRSEQGGHWYRFDDQLVRKLRDDADFFAVVIEVIQSRCHPVAVFYEQNRLFTDDFRLSEQDWLKMEQWAYNLDSYRDSISLTPSTCKICGGPSKSCNSCLNSWSCLCGAANKEQWLACPKCGKPKPGLEPWKCSKCGHFNKASSKHCEVCPRSDERETHRWRCCACAHFNQPNTHKCAVCLKSRSHIARACVRCSTVFVTDTLIYCYNCLTMLTRSATCSCPKPQPVHLCTECSLDMRACIRCRKLNWGQLDRCAGCLA